MSERAFYRYEIQHGPDGEANYAWVYFGSEIIATMRTHHAKAMCDAMSLDDRLYMLSENWKGRTDTAVGDEIRRRCASDLLKELSRGVEPATTPQERD